MNETDDEVKATITTAMNCIQELHIKAKAGGVQAAAGLHCIGTEAAKILENLAINETRINPRGGVVRDLARKSLNWPYRLSAISDIRIGTSAGNPEKFLKFLMLGSETPIDLGINRKGRARNFQKRAGFVLKVYQQITQDRNRYVSMTDDEIRNTRYHSWSFATMESRDPMCPIPVPKPSSLHNIFASYVIELRKLTDNMSEDWVNAAVLWAKVETEDRIDDDGIWPPPIYAAATSVGGGVEAQLRKLFKKDFSSIVKKPCL